MENTLERESLERIIGEKHINATTFLEKIIYNVLTQSLSETIILLSDF